MTLSKRSKLFSFFLCVFFFFSLGGQAYANPRHPYLSKFPDAEKQLEKLMREAQIEPLEPIPADLSIKLLDTKEARLYSLSRHRGKVILLSRWATWCGACKQELPRKLAMQKQINDPRLVLLGVSDEDRETVRAFEKKDPNHYPISLIDSSEIVQKFFPTSGLPTTFLIDAWGWVIGQRTGGIAWDSPPALALLRYLLSMQPAQPLRDQAPAPEASFPKRLRVRVGQEFTLPVTLRWTGESDRYARLAFRLPKDPMIQQIGIEASAVTANQKGNQRTYILRLQLKGSGRFEIKPILLNYWLKDYDQHFQADLGSIAIQASALAPLGTIPPWAIWTTLGATLAFLLFLGLAFQKSSQEREKTALPPSPPPTDQKKS